MQEEVENRTVNLAISTSKLTAHSLVTAFQKYMRHRNEVKAKKGAKKAEIIYCNFYHRLWTNDRDLSDDKPCSNSILHIWKQRTKSDRTELSAFTLCAWFSGIPDYDLRWYLCGADTGSGVL